jgi:hypothetical protein
MPLTVTPPPAATTGGHDARPLACIACCGRGAARRRKEDRLAAVLSEFGFRCHVAGAAGDDGPALDDDRLAALDGARLVVCDVVRPAQDLPAELAVAATRGLPVVALVPAGVAVEGLAAELLADCGASVVRYAAVEPHRALHARLVAEATPARR